MTLPAAVLLEFAMLRKRQTPLQLAAVAVVCVGVGLATVADTQARARSLAVSAYGGHHGIRVPRSGFPHVYACIWPEWYQELWQVKPLWARASPVASVKDQLAPCR